MYYRLYLDGRMAASGPARTAHHYCRVDEISQILSGHVQVAVEVRLLISPENIAMTARWSRDFWW